MNVVSGISRNASAITVIPSFLTEAKVQNAERYTREQTNEEGSLSVACTLKRCQQRRQVHCGPSSSKECSTAEDVKKCVITKIVVRAKPTAFSLEGFLTSIPPMYTH